MADNNATKKAFSIVFKELMKNESFHKISIADICEKCEKNRKSFYYHFKDKYDLANQTFDTDFPFMKTALSTADFGNTIRELCRHLYDNRQYYRKLLEIECQNSFSDHLRLELRSFFERCNTKNEKFASVFFADAVFYSIKNWLLSKKCSPFPIFSGQLLECVRTNTAVLH